MKDFLLIFDKYNIRARISVGVIVVSPLLVQVQLVIPNLNGLSTTAVLIFIAVCLCNLLVIIPRVSNDRITKSCFGDELPTERLLQPADCSIDDITKQRYYGFLRKSIRGISFDTSDEEKLRNSIISSVAWLRSNTRDKTKFPLIYEENINYGFARNLYGLKRYGVLISVVSMIVDMAILVIEKTAIYTNRFSLAGASISFVISVLFLLMWVIVVKEELVRFCGEKYARELLSACDYLEQDSKQ